MHDVLKNARDIGECVTLKIFLRIEHVALKYLLADLEERSHECAQESEPSAKTARRHRLAIDEAYRRFDRIASLLPVQNNDESIRMQINHQMVDFLRQLLPLLPTVDTTPLSLPSHQVPSWNDRHRRAAKEIAALKHRLQGFCSQLENEIEEKERICEEIVESIGRVGRII